MVAKMWRNMSQDERMDAIVKATELLEGTVAKTQASLERIVNRRPRPAPKEVPLPSPAQPIRK